jgi:energy-coupling factor transporter ATP-binding protein EcfA2
MLKIRPGDAFGCLVNSHRDGWAGAICREAASWNCGTRPESFRADYCAVGVDRCYHVNLFNPSHPCFVVHSSGGDWLLEGNEHLLDDQLLLFWAPRAREPHGISQRGESVLAGAYRVKSAHRIDHGNWAIEPYESAWVDLSDLHLRPPYGKEAGGKYFKQVDRSAVVRLFQEAVERVAAPGRTWSVARRERFERFHKSLEGWLDQAAKLMSGILPEQEWAPARVASPVLAPRNQALKGLLDLDIRTRAPKPSPAPAIPAKSTPRTVPDGVPEDVAQAAAKLYGEETLRCLRLALAVKPLVLFAGPSGSGKSHLALRLMDDPKRERTLVVPVASTWRGSEDLLGHVNPIDGLFEPTPFTHFLFRAASAWDAGDRGPWHVVFEEFNLSRPEFWMSEVLARSQYGAEDRADRTIHLGGQGVRGHDGPQVSQVFLSPAVRFVGTLNSDPSSPPLSSRVLDRAALVHLELDPRVALETVGVALEDEVNQAIFELDGILRERGVGFSLRAAHSLASLHPRAADFGLDAWGVADHVLAQEVLSKVCLFAADPADGRWVERLADWSSGLGSRLTSSGRIISDWGDRLENGLDVQQT